MFLAYGLHQKTVTMMFHEKQNAMVCSPNSNTEFFLQESCKEIHYTIYVYNLPRLRTSSINKSDRKKKKKQADKIHRKNDRCRLQRI